MIKILLRSGLPLIRTKSNGSSTKLVTVDRCFRPHGSDYRRQMHIKVFSAFSTRGPAPAVRRRHPAVIASKGLPLAAFPIFGFQGEKEASQYTPYQPFWYSLASQSGDIAQTYFLTELRVERTLSPSYPYLRITFFLLQQKSTSFFSSVKFWEWEQVEIDKSKILHTHTNRSDLWLHFLFFDKLTDKLLNAWYIPTTLYTHQPLEDKKRRHTHW